jgi:hypothetical protein
MMRNRKTETNRDLKTVIQNIAHEIDCAKILVEMAFDYGEASVTWEDMSQIKMCVAQLNELTEIGVTPSQERSKYRKQ